MGVLSARCPARPCRHLLWWLVGATAGELGSHFFFFFPLFLSFGVLVILGFMDRELEGIFPSGCFLFQLWGCPASALAVAGNGGSVLWAHSFFGTVAWYLFKTLLFPSYATRVVTTFPVCLPRAPALR